MVEELTGAYVKRIFENFDGEWSIDRKIESRTSSSPSGTLIGTATFVKRDPTADEYSAEYLYLEEGDLTFQSGFTVKAKRRYVYRLSKEETGGHEKITTWFVKVDNEDEVDYFFHDFVFLTDNEGISLSARGSHPCVNDMYYCLYNFPSESFSNFNIEYLVQGPNKDYTISTKYSKRWD
ncbi:hypothetical protein V1511DRAFT_507006 [Dipodascopsis uninucleata]